MSSVNRGNLDEGACRDFRFNVLLSVNLFTTSVFWIEMLDSDRELLLLWRKDRSAGFRRIYDRYASVLLRYVYRFTGNQEHAEEILQDLFTEVLKAEFESADFHLKAWLFTIAKNKSLNFERRRRHEVLSEAPLQEAVATQNLEEDFYDQQIFERFQTLQSDLPDDLARTWELRRQGLDYQQISEHLRIPLGTVKSRFSRLVDYFRKEFKLE